MGRVANPRDIFIFHRARKSRGPKIEEDKPELSIDDPELTAQEKLQKVRMRTLMQEFLKAQQVQVVTESYMTDALDKFIEKDDPGAVQQCAFILLPMKLNSRLIILLHRAAKILPEGIKGHD